jgi:hypothetical protein
VTRRLDNRTRLVKVGKDFFHELSFALPGSKSAIQFKLLLGKRDVAFGFVLSEIPVELGLAFRLLLIEGEAFGMN